MTTYLHSVITGKRNDLGARCVRLGLIPFSYVYGIGIFIKEFFWRIQLLSFQKVSRPVISVGNITWGGVGKTPLVIWLARQIQQQGLRPAILMRGYKGQKTELSGSTSNDEALMIQSVLPKVGLGINKNRVQVAQQLLSRGKTDVFLLDDGFQHRVLARDLNIVAVDATNPFGSGWLIPAGILREPLTHLSRADIIVITKTDLVSQQELETLRNKLSQIHPPALLVESIHQAVAVENLVTGQEYPLSYLSGQSVAVCSSIGDPKSFESMVQKQGAQIKKLFRFRDHHWYTVADVTRILEECRQAGVEMLVTTLKDAVKLKNFRNLLGQWPCLILKIDLQVTRNQNEFLQRVNHLLRH